MPLIDEKYEEPIGVAVLAASAIGPAGILFPAFDMAGIGVIWTTMVGSIAKKSKHRVDAAGVTKVVVAAVGAASGYALGSRLLSWGLIVLFPFAGVPSAMAANAALNGLFTFKLGAATAKQFDRPDFNALDFMNVATTIASAMTPIPSAEELELIKKMIANA